MKRSIDHILTTHAGSLPRPDDLAHMMYDLMDGKPVNQTKLQARVTEAIAEVVKRQIDLGIDVISDGEMSKPNFQTYVTRRLTGFGTTDKLLVSFDDLAEFPEVARKTWDSEGAKHRPMPEVIGPIKVSDANAVLRDINDLKAAMGNRSPDDAFIPAAPPSLVTASPNRYYKSFDEYTEAVCAALSYEYKAIIDAGFNLQLDAPDLPMHGHAKIGNDQPRDIKKYIPAAIEAMNHAIRGLPPDKIRLHVCWGNYAGPHHLDVELRQIVEPILKINASFIYVEAANPRHEHEWEVWKEVKLPDGKALIPGVIDSVTNHVEHPRLVAQRLEQFANIVGKENVIAGTDCGFGTYVGMSACDPKVAWLKLQTLVEGARIASQKLF
ncbi:MAG TPA: cobalamin-independent methionine synthase II family protein [Candidatus Binataceae bacterium]|nr:cobalamin-independent methionine synthase II family protein [Candidatus Binataceae bacterium]